MDVDGEYADARFEAAISSAERTRCDRVVSSTPSRPEYSDRAELLASSCRAVEGVVSAEHA